MPELTFWNIVWIVLWVATVQLFTQFLIDRTRNWFSNKKNNTLYKLYINDEYTDTKTYAQCREMYENTPYKTMKSCGHDRKKKRFNIHIDTR